MGRWIVSALNLVFMLVILLSFGEVLVYGVPWPIRVTLVIPIVTGILSLAFCVAFTHIQEGAAMRLLSSLAQEGRSFITMASGGITPLRCGGRSTIHL